MKTIKESVKDLYDRDYAKDLKKNYDEALKNDDFKDLVSKLKLDREFLQNYTSSLETSSIEYHHCQNCKSILECKNEIEGYAYLPIVKNDALVFKYKKCKYLKKLEEENSYLKNINVIGASVYLQDAKMKDIFTNDKNRFKVISSIKQFIDNYPNDKHLKGLYVCGNFGSGKTYLLTAMLNELAKKNFKSTIVFLPDFLRELKASFQNDYNVKYELAKKTPILLIDDIGAEVITPWGRDEILCPLIQYRMEQKLPTFFTSNLNLEQLKEHLSVTKDGIDLIKASRITERIKQLTSEIEMISKNLRN